MKYKLLREDHRRNSKKPGFAALIFATILLASCPPPGPPIPDPDPDPNNLAMGDFNTLAAAGNTDPYGIWSDGTTMWVADIEDSQLYAYNLRSKERDPDKDFGLVPHNTDPHDIWGNAETIWVADNEDAIIYAYGRGTRNSDSGKDITLTDNQNPTGIWSDGRTMWVVDNLDDKIYAYNLNGTRAADKDFNALRAAGNTASRGIWFGGATMWVADRTDNKLYAYNLRTRMHEPGTPDNMAPPENTLLDIPENLRFIEGNLRVVLTWDAVTDAASYKIYRDGDEEDIATITATETSTSYTYEDTNRTNGTPYRYTVQAVGSNGSESNSKEVRATPALPVAPLNLSATSENTQVVLTWDMVPGATSYRIYRNGDANAIGTVDSPNTTYTDGTVVSGTAYSYTVRAVKSILGRDDVSAESDPATANPSTLPPQNLRATPGNAQVMLSWDMVTGATSYRIYRNGATDEIGTVNRPNTTYTDNTARNGTSYRYTVRSVGSNEAESLDSSPAPPLDDEAVIPNEPPAPPSLIMPLELTPGRDGVVLNWGMVPNAASYRIYRSGPGATSFTRIDPPNTIIRGLTYTDTGLAIGDYSYTVRAVGNTGVKSGDSTPATTTVPTIDFYHLGNAGITSPRAIWSNGTTMWVAGTKTGETAAKIFAYDLRTEKRDPTMDFDLVNDPGDNNNNPSGLWSNNTTMWVMDSLSFKIFAYKMIDKSRDPSKDIAVRESDMVPFTPSDIWSNGTTMWVRDESVLRAYNLSRAIAPGSMVSDTRDSSLDISPAANGNPVGIWANDTTLWVTNNPPPNDDTDDTDNPEDKLYAYNLDETRSRAATMDFDTLNAAGNNAPVSIWSNDTTMWVLDRTDSIIYSYNLNNKMLISPSPR